MSNNWEPSVRYKPLAGFQPGGIPLGQLTQTGGQTPPQTYFGATPQVQQHAQRVGPQAALPSSFSTKASFDEEMGVVRTIDSAYQSENFWKDPQSGTIYQINPTHITKNSDGIFDFANTTARTFTAAGGKAGIWDGFFVYRVESGSACLFRGQGVLDAPRSDRFNLELASDTSNTLITNGEILIQVRGRSRRYRIRQIIVEGSLLYYNSAVGSFNDRDFYHPLEIGEVYVPNDHFLEALINSSTTINHAGSRDMLLSFAYLERY